MCQACNMVCCAGGESRGCGCTSCGCSECLLRCLRCGGIIDLDECTCYLYEDDEYDNFDDLLPDWSEDE